MLIDFPVDPPSAEPKRLGQQNTTTPEVSTANGTTVNAKNLRPFWNRAELNQSPSVGANAIQSQECKASCEYIQHKHLVELRDSIARTGIAPEDSTPLQGSILEITCEKLLGITHTEITNSGFGIPQIFKSRDLNPLPYCPACLTRCRKYDALRRHLQSWRDESHRNTRNMASETCFLCGSRVGRGENVWNHVKFSHSDRSPEILEQWLRSIKLPQSMYIPPASRSFLCLLTF